MYVLAYSKNIQYFVKGVMEVSSPLLAAGFPLPKCFMNFWDTLRGHQLADTLIRCLPKLVGSKQTFKSFDTKEDAVKYIESEIQNGNRFVSLIDDRYGYHVIIENR